MTSSANSTHLYSKSCAFFSRRRYSGMLIFHWRVNTLGSSMVASYCKRSRGPIGSVALDHVQRIAVPVPGTVEPGGIIEAGDIDH